MSNYHFDEESLLELAKGIDDKGFKTTIKCNIGEDGFVESGSLDLLTKPGIYKLQICVLSDEAKQMLQEENINGTFDIFGYCYVNIFTRDKIINFGQQTVTISEDLSKLKKFFSDDEETEEFFSHFIKALPKLLYTRTITYDGTNYTFSDWEEKTDNVLKLILADYPIEVKYGGYGDLKISHTYNGMSFNPLGAESNGNFEAITAVGLDDWGHVDKITTTNYSINPATSTQNGLMSSADKTYIESIKPVLEVDGSDKLVINNGVKVDGNTILKGYFNQGLNTVTTGIYAHAEGNGSIASGSYSHAEGYSSIASNVSHSEGSYTVSSGKSSHSEGNYTELLVIVKESSTKFLINNPEFIVRAGMYVRYGDNYSKITEVNANSGKLTISLLNSLPIVAGLYIILMTVADNIGSHAEGTSSSSIGSSAHAEGAYNLAAGNRAHSEGYNTYAYANLSHAEGYKSKASGHNSHAEGSTTIASGSQAHAEGDNTTASGSNSHAEGSGTVASGYASHAEGYLCRATGDYSRATGVNTTASHLFSNVNGRNTKSSNNYQTVIGRANADKGDALFIIGNGTVNNDNTVKTASNAFVVTSSGNGVFSGSCTASAFPNISDSRLKDVISDLDISRAYNLIENCSTILYALKSEADLENKRVQVGLLAQEVKEFFPEIVYEDADGFLSLDYSRLTVIILKVLKDVINRISILENKI